MSMQAQQILSRLESMADPAAREGMARYGINVETAYGIKVTTLRELAKEIGRDHHLALELWDSSYHEARILATIVDDPKQVTEAQMETWVKDVNSWDLCDGLTGNLLDKTSFAYEKAIEWSGREEEFVKRAGFALMAWLPVHDKKAPDEKFEAFFRPIEVQSDDERIYVKKAISWALRNIGKRSLNLNAKAVALAERIGQRSSKPAQWIARDALNELTSAKILERLQRKTGR